MNYKDEIELLPDILQKGLGRAFDYVQPHNQLKIRTYLLNACLHNLVYDPQCETSRAEWLFQLINTTGEREFYRENIFLALPKTNNFWDLNQLYDLVYIWAKQGNLEAKGIIYSTFSKQTFHESWLGGEQIIDLDGIQGLLAVAEIVGSRLLQDYELWEDDNLIAQAKDSYGSEKVRLALEQEARHNVKVKAYLDAVQAYKQRNANIRHYQQDKNIAVDFHTLIQKIEEDKNNFYLLRKFGLYAPQNDIEKSFEKLLLETRKKQLIRYLRIFKYRLFPRLESRLFDLAASNIKTIQSATIIALALNQNSSLRDLAIRLIQQNSESVKNGVLKLFINNYNPGDFAIIESTLDISQDIEFRHQIGLEIIKILESQKTSELVNCCFWVYENTPCSHCRQKIVEILISLQKITPSMIKECLYDCSLEIQALVRVC